MQNVTLCARKHSVSKLFDSAWVGQAETKRMVRIRSPSLARLHARELVLAGHRDDCVDILPSRAEPRAQRLEHRR